MNPVDLTQFGSNLATQKVIGFSSTKTKVTKKGSRTDSISVGIQAWELAIMVAAAGAYYYLTGDHIQDAIIKAANMINPGNPANGLGAVTTLPLVPVNPNQEELYEQGNGAANSSSNMGCIFNCSWNHGGYWQL